MLLHGRRIPALRVAVKSVEYFLKPWGSTTRAAAAKSFKNAPKCTGFVQPKRQAVGIFCRMASLFRGQPLNWEHSVYYFECVTPISCCTAARHRYLLFCSHCVDNGHCYIARYAGDIGRRFVHITKKKSATYFVHCTWTWCLSYGRFLNTVLCTPRRVLPHSARQNCFLSFALIRANFHNIYNIGMVC